MRVMCLMLITASSPHPARVCGAMKVKVCHVRASSGLGGGGVYLETYEEQAGGCNRMLKMAFWDGCGMGQKAAVEIATIYQHFRLPTFLPVGQLASGSQASFLTSVRVLKPGPGRRYWSSASLSALE